MSANSNSDFKLAISTAASIECTNTVVTSSVSCIFPVEITSLANSPKSLSGNFFAVVDGKIYLADISYGGINSISETWNPGESKSGVVPFLVPANSNISSIFLGPEESSAIDNAVLSLNLNVTAVDGWTREIQSRLSAVPKVNDLISRLRESSGYPWQVLILSSPSQDDNDIALIHGLARQPNKSLKDGKILPQCFATIYSDTKGVSFTTSYVSTNNLAVYEDLKSGLGITTDIGATESEYCRAIISSTPQVKELK
jgi:hypothetical protein